jgi:uncharacterized protein YecE (DUF72 family)
VPGNSLFDFEESSFDRDRLRDRLRQLAARNIRIGGSSWKYQGWIDQIYTRQRYTTRGRLSKKRFEDNCLEEYVTVFPTVCGDFAFYQFPSVEHWTKLFRVTPADFRWALKVPEQITVAEWPLHARYGALAGQPNPSFLDAHLFQQGFLAALEPWREKIGVLIFEFGASQGHKFENARDFARAVDRFLAQLPTDWRYAIEIRNPDLLVPIWFKMLAAHNVAHVYNAWTRMPEIRDQMAIPDSRTSDIIVARALVRRGRTYEEAVQTFAPYDKVVEVNEPVRQALRDLIDMALADAQPAFLYLNNRLEGNSPTTIMAITE